MHAEARSTVAIVATLEFLSSARIDAASSHQRTIRSGIGPLKAFARRLKPYSSRVLAHWRWPLGTCPIEITNNKIRVIKRMAYGLGDGACFILKIRAAFAGIR
jgi:transposase